jgi:hypothetical protein
MRGTQVKQKHEVGVNKPEDTEDCKLQWANAVEHVMTFVCNAGAQVSSRYFLMCSGLRCLSECK